MSNTSERIISIIADKLVIDESEITREANFKRDLGTDHIDLVELMMEFEREFDVPLPEDNTHIKTVGDAIKYIEEQL